MVAAAKTVELPSLQTKVHYYSEGDGATQI